MLNRCRCISPWRSVFITVAVAVSLVCGGWIAAQELPNRVRTNDPGQIAGEQVLIFGQGFTPNEVVQLDVVHADGTAEPGMGHSTFTVVAGADGAFVTTWVIRPQDAQGDQFQVNARGTSTGVITATSFDRTVSVGTDKFAYGPSDQALISGTGFLPGEGVTLQVVHNNGEAEPNAGHDPWVVTADSAGEINSAVPMNPADTAGNEFILKAHGDASGLAAGAAIMDSLACPPAPPPDTVVPTPIPSAPCPPNLNSCTANDVVTTVVAANPVGGDVCGTRTDSLTLQFTVEFQTTASQRYDLGIFVSEDGGTVTNGSGNTPPTALVCGGLAPQVGDGDGNADTSDCDSDKFLDLDPTGHAPNNAAVDTCGDLQQNAGPVFLTVTATVSCETVDANLHLKVPSCRVWEQNANHQVACTSLAQAGTGSKCDCTDLDFTTVLNPCVTALCDDDNVCTTDSCTVESGQAVCHHDPVADGTSCDDDTVCDGHEVCGSGTCQPGTPLDCNDHNVCTTDSCDPVNGCQNVDNTNPCSDGNACTSGDVCAGGSCQSGSPVVCNDGNVCTTDTCDPFTGCVYTNNTDPCDDGNPCTTGDTCGGGTCNGGSSPSCDDGNPCTDDSCDPTSGCVHTNNTNPCDDGNACTTGDTCGGGTCNGGPAPNCDDGNVCTVDSCDPSTGCVHDPGAANGNPCDDGNACTGAQGNEDHCNDGTCEGGGAVVCDDGNVCTTDSCNPASGCVYTNNTNPCDDGNACTTGDICGAGSCHSGAPLVCNDGNVCTTDSCNPASGCVYTNNTDPCNDGNACTTNDTCGGGTCNGGPAPNCDDGNPCTDDSCNPTSGCVHTNNTAPCNDGNACTTGDTCGGGTCNGGPAPNCDDGNPCTDDSCNPTSGCVHTNNTAPCNDGNACTTGDTCGGGTCNGGPAPNCDDGNPCTDDSCNPTSGCVHTNNTSPCNDGNACTTGDTCGGGTCHGGSAPNCDDGNPCTDDSCNPASGCVHTNNTAPCNDGNACTTGDTCGGGTCHGGPATNCDDGNVCTTDSCNPATGCAHVNNTAPCNDGNACTTNDTCGGGTCHGGSAPNCNDGNPCTTDSCNPATGCVHAGSDGSDNSCGQVTDTMYCALPTGLCGNSPTTPEFRLLDLQTPTFSSALNKTVMNDYLINASNPGQFYYNVFYAGTPGSAVNLTIEVSYPFVTQGANPIQVHDGVTLSGGCYVPSPSLSGFTITTDGGQSSSGSPIIVRTDYSAQQLGSTTAVYVSGTVPASGLVYVTIHLDYGLKKISGWQQASNQTTAQGPDTNLDNVLDGLGDGPIYIQSPQPYAFDFSGGGPTHTYTPSSCNTFKKSSGVNGNTLKLSTGNPVSGVRVQFFDPHGSLIATTTTDADGFYNFTYKAKGKTQTYTVKLPDYGKQKGVVLKANGYAQATFDDLP